jgi:hypothetical protein
MGELGRASVQPYPLPFSRGDCRAILRSSGSHLKQKRAWLLVRADGSRLGLAKRLAKTAAVDAFVSSYPLVHPTLVQKPVAASEGWPRALSWATWLAEAPTVDALHPFIYFLTVSIVSLAPPPHPTPRRSR